MARSPSPTDFTVPVEGIGLFTFAKRKIADEVKCQVEYARMIEGVEPTPWLHALACWISDLKVLTVRAPDGWEVDELDPFDSETYSKLGKVHKALMDKEGSFRRGPNQAGKAGGQGDGANAGVLVSPEVQPAANGSAVS